MSGFALFAERRYTWNGNAFGVKEVGYVFAYVGFLGIILQGGLIGRLVQRFGEQKLVSSGFAQRHAGFGLIGFTYDCRACSWPAALHHSAPAYYGRS